ncbi:MAG TPA: N-acetylglucosamine-specific PTS transporter subunit IIBC [Steroidobacteraceae bacterium]|nr:N-acetylglucosamine-specific PTS transporter subunit IIBC [Steroidobacteraceae bacterium]
MTRVLAALQSLGRALMLPIAVLPVAGLLLRLGQPDLLNLAPVAAAGDAVFSNLGLLFAIGVAVGLARENHGAAGLAALVGYLVASRGAQVLLPLPPAAVAGLAGTAQTVAADAYRAQELAKLSVPLGIITGVIAGLAYNRFANVRLPDYLAFFGGRRFVPIVTGCIGLALAGVFGFGWPYLEHGMDAVSRTIIGAGAPGLFAYGLLNRLLIITGLHHILNNLAWFIVGDYHGVTGDMKRFFAGDPTAGAFMSGFFPVMMFGLPAACLAMYHTALPARRKAVGGMLLSMALTAFLTGVTEPIEFSFMFLAPALYGLHAVLTGLAMVVMQLAGVHLGFTFSAGFIDYVLNYGKATRPLLLLPVGLAYFAVYYASFRVCIVRLNLATPGREREAAGAARGADAGAAAGAAAAAGPAGAGAATAGIAAARARVAGAAGSAGSAGEGADYLHALGGADNLRSVDACTTRLRLMVNRSDALDREALKRLGARGVIELGGGAVQVVLGPMADRVAGNIRAALAGAAPGAADPATAPAAAQLPQGVVDAALAALGGRANVVSLELGGDRLLLRLKDEQALDEAGWGGLGARGIARPHQAMVQILLGPAAVPLHAQLQAQLRAALPGA